jgi:hypothetical protein
MPPSIFVHIDRRRRKPWALDYTISIKDKLKPHG